MSSVNLLGSTAYVSTPFIKVKIGDYEFGIYDKLKQTKGVDEYGAYQLNHIRFPNYVKSLDITKINGQVNTYKLVLEYTITENDDPNFFEKVFSSVSKSRKIVFSYGDLSVPHYIYKDEEAIITDVKSQFAIASSKITYTVSAVSKCQLLSIGTYPLFPGRFDKPSTVIKELLNDESFGLLQIFYGMRNNTVLNGVKLIPDDDMPKQLNTFTNTSVLDYLRYLVDEMTPMDSSDNLKGSLYSLLMFDDVSGELQGPYFKIVRVDSVQAQSDAYSLDIGYISKDSVVDFRIDNDESYAIYYDYAKQLNDASYVQRINARGELEEVYAPIVSSGNSQYKTRESDKSWWTKITSYPVKASVTIKGLLRPAILMTHMRLNVLFYGKKHISSGLYVITKQQDSISEAGFRTTLNLMRIASDTTTS